jgi:hypothetical protein
MRAHENGIHVIERLRSEYNDDEIPGMLSPATPLSTGCGMRGERLLLLHKPVSISYCARRQPPDCSVRCIPQKPLPASG